MISNPIIFVHSFKNVFLRLEWIVRFRELQKLWHQQCLHATKWHLILKKMWLPTKEMFTFLFIFFTFISNGYHFDRSCIDLALLIYSNHVSHLITYHISFRYNMIYHIPKTTIHHFNFIKDILRIKLIAF